MTGSKWVPSDIYIVKLEGACFCRYKSGSLAIIHEKCYTKNIRAWAVDVETSCNANVRKQVDDYFTPELRIIGLNATLEDLNRMAQIGSEVGILAKVTAENENTANKVAKILNPYLHYHRLTEQEEMPTFAFPFSPNEIFRGEIYEFCMKHIMILKDPVEAFYSTVEEISE